MDLETRALTSSERALIEKLLEHDFPGRNELRIQLDSTVARPLASEGMISLNCSKGSPAPVKHSLAVEGYTTDSDGIPIWVMLFVHAGFLDMLEIVKSDGGPIAIPPTASALIVPQ